jgi:hypothetical protein
MSPFPLVVVAVGVAVGVGLPFVAVQASLCGFNDGVEWVSECAVALKYGEVERRVCGVEELCIGFDVENGLRDSVNEGGGDPWFPVLN